VLNELNIICTVKFRSGLYSGMRRTGYQKLRDENEELREKLRMYENGVFDVKLDEW